jgi:hypothetical protein
MYVAIAYFRNSWFGEDLDKMIDYVDRKNEEAIDHKYFLVELDHWDYSLYKRNRNFKGCHPTIVYDPYDVGQMYLKSQATYSDGFVRTFGSRSTDH